MEEAHASGPAAALKWAVRRLPLPMRTSLRQIAHRTRRLGELSLEQNEEADRRKFFRYAFLALAYNTIGGDYVEFGCWSATTFRMAFDESRRKPWEYACRMWAFDSFDGLPAPQSGVDEHPRWQRGNMAMTQSEFEGVCRSHGIPRSAYKIVPGWYEDTLRPGPQADLPDDISLAYVDCDLYSSTRTVLEFLLPRLKHGMFLVLDDYYSCSSSQPSGERRALLEVLGDHPTYRLVPYLRFGWSSLAFQVEDRRLLPDVSDAHDALSLA